MWGHKLFADVLWKIDKNAIAGGLSLGLFVAFMPTLGFQMLLATVGAILFKVNLPIALAACWVTNPLTAMPIYMAAWRLGKYILEDFTPLRDIFDLHGLNGKGSRFMLYGIYVSTGSFIFSLLSALGAQVCVRIAWFVGGKLRHADKNS